MSKINKKDDKKDSKEITKEIKVEEKKLDEKKEERREQKKLFMEDVGMNSTTKADDVSLKDLVEKAKQNDPNVGIEGYKALVTAHKDSKELQTVKVEEHPNKDHFGIVMFMGAILGVIILLTLFGGPYSPLSLLGSTFNPKVIDVTPVNTNITTTVIPEPEVPVAVEEVPKPIQNISKVTEVNITFSNWKITPEVVNIKAGSTVLNIKTGETPVDVMFEGLGVAKVHIVPGTDAKIEFNSTVGTYKIRMIAYSGSMNIEAVGTLVVE